MTRKTLGRYEIRSELGRGGMATVYRAYDPEFDRDVAIKVLPAQFTHDPTFNQRFRDEARLIARVEHYAIVPVYDFGEDNGWPYLVMRLMTGGTLADRLAERRLTFTEILQNVDRLSAALEKAHEANIVHRDLKPKNVLFDASDLSYLSDFGIARLAEGTRSMTILGTPEYMAPEQAQGLPLDKRTDIYQFGVVLFEMLTGKVPFEADTTVALLYKHVHEPVPAVRELNAKLPPGTGAVIRKAMAKDPEDRYATAAELAAALARALAPATGATPYAGQSIEPRAVAPADKKTSPPAERSTEREPLPAAREPVRAAPATKSDTEAPRPSPSLPASPRPLWRRVLPFVAVFVFLCCAGATVLAFAANLFDGNATSTPEPTAVIAEVTEPVAAVTEEDVSPRATILAELTAAADQLAQATPRPTRTPFPTPTEIKVLPPTFTPAPVTPTAVPFTPDIASDEQIRNTLKLYRSGAILSYINAYSYRNANWATIYYTGNALQAIQNDINTLLQQGVGLTQYVDLQNLYILDYRTPGPDTAQFESCEFWTGATFDPVTQTILETRQLLLLKRITMQRFGSVWLITEEITEDGTPFC